MKIRCVIIDDEQLARQLLEGYIAKIPSLELVASLKNPIDALDIMQTEVIDLMFVDIQMPEIRGTSLVKGLNKANGPMIIFTTAYRDYAVEGFELGAMDYMLKPIAFDRFLLGVNKTIEQKSLRQSIGVSSQTPDITRVEKNFVVLKANHRIYRVKFNDILYIEGLSEYVTFHTSSGRIVMLESLKKLSETLPRHLFVRCHRSFMVNIEKISSLYGNQLELGAKKIPIGKSYKEQVMCHFETH